MGTTEEISTAVLKTLRNGEWDWYTLKGIERQLNDVRDGNGDRILNYSTRKLRTVLEDLKTKGEIKSRPREGVKFDEYGVTERSI